MNRRRGIALKVKKAKPRLVVIGNGMTATRAVEELLARAPDVWDIVVFGAEPGGCYNRISLSGVLAAEKTLADVVTHPPGWYSARGIVLHAGDAIVAIDVAGRRVRSASGRTQSFDELLICTGATPNMPALPGAELSGVMTFRTFADASVLLNAARPGRPAVVVGGGVLGLEAAAGLARRGMTVTLVHQHGHVMDRQLDAHAGSLVQRQLLERGVQTILHGRTARIEGHARVRAVRLGDGRALEADIVVFAIGITPDCHLARSAGIDCGRGITVDDAMRTNCAHVSAVGECAEHRGVCHGLVAPLYAQAASWARGMCGDQAAAQDSAPSATRLKVTGVEVFSAGDVSAADCAELVYREPRRGTYKRLLLRDAKLIGAVLCGDTTDAAWYLDLMQAGSDVTPIRDGLLHGRAACVAAA